MEIENLEQLFLIKNVKFYVLQKSLNKKEKTFIVNHKNITDLSGQLKNLTVTGAIINNLDLIITVDTSIVHLSGSLGKNTWLLLPFSPDWRWMLKRNDSPWYSSVEIFRQATPGNWENVIFTIKNKLEKLLCL